MIIPRLIGITAAAGSGKDTLADHIAANFGHVKYALASPIKQLLNERFGWTDEMWNDRQWKEAGHPQCGSIWNGGPRHFSPRSWAQWLGTDVGRALDANVWVNQMLVKWERLPRSQGLVVPDVRFNNEAHAIREHLGVIVRIDRPSATPINAHISENGVDPSLIDATISNDRSIDDFLTEAVSVLRNLRGDV